MPVLISRVRLRASENGQRGAQLDGGRYVDVLQDAAQAREGESVELAHGVFEAPAALAPNLFHGLLEARIVLKPVIDSSAVDADGVGRGGNGAAPGEEQRLWSGLSRVRRACGDWQAAQGGGWA